MRPVERGLHPVDGSGNPVIYSEYSRARRDLIDRLGEYCSYCEVRLAASLAVEHIEPKTLNPHLELIWSNFLLACTNCNSTKGHKPVVIADYVWPHLDNSFQYFSYLITGHVKISSGLSTTAEGRAQKMIDLVGLDRIIPRAGTIAYNEASDRRFENRFECFVTAQEVKNELETAPDSAKPYIINEIIRLAIFRGFWSVWMTVFHDKEEIKLRLIDEMTGTCKTCFNDQGNPIDRP